MAESRKFTDFTNSEPVDFFAGAFRNLEDNQTPHPALQLTTERRRRPHRVAAAFLLACLGGIVFGGNATENGQRMLRDATVFIERDRSITHGEDNPAIARQRAAIAQGTSPKVFALPNNEQPVSTLQTHCSPYEIKPNDSPWSVAEHYARIYDLNETKLRALKDDIAQAVGGEQDMQLDDGSFTVCVQEAPLPIPQGN